MSRRKFNIINFVEIFITIILFTIIFYINFVINNNQNINNKKYTNHLHYILKL